MGVTIFFTHTQIIGSFWSGYKRKILQILFLNKSYRRAKLFEVVIVFLLFFSNPPNFASPKELPVKNFIDCKKEGTILTRQIDRECDEKRQTN